MSDLTAALDALGRLGSAAVLGGAIGLEREIRRHWAGLRTHMLVALGAALFVAAGRASTPELGTGASRVIQGIAAGVGFIGAGAIMKLTDRREIKGLTTASSLWMAAAVGTTCGMALYTEAVVATLTALLVLVLLRPLERTIDPPENTPG
jgi:putative Mg2+ transporter-C (MgtC) family protein